MSLTLLTSLSFQISSEIAQITHSYTVDNRYLKQISLVMEVICNIYTYITHDLAKTFEGSYTYVVDNIYGEIRRNITIQVFSILLFSLVDYLPVKILSGELLII